MATRRPPDSSEEEEATAIDLRSSSQAFKPGAPSPARPTSPPSGSAPASAKAPPQTISKAASTPLHSSEDEEATEFLSMRPSSSSSASAASSPSSSPSGIGGDPASSPSSLRARGRAVPLEGDEASTPNNVVARSRESRESPVSEKLVDKPDLSDAPMVARSAPTLPARTPRPLPGERQTNVKSETQTGSTSVPGSSAPRITRIFAADAADEARTDPGEDDEVTDPPGQRAPVKPRPLPGSADQISGPVVPSRPAPRPATIVALGTPDEKRTDEKNPGDNDRRPKTMRTTVPSSETLEAKPPDGTLIVEVPDGAVVFVNGVERGVGPSLKVTEIDRYAKHAVRIHAPGYAPWSGSVCLEGRTAAKIRPGLKAKK